MKTLRVADMELGKIYTMRVGFNSQSGREAGKPDEWMRYQFIKLTDGVYGRFDPQGIS